MPKNRIAEVVYRLTDAFTGPVNTIVAGYKRLTGAANTADAQVSASAKATDLLAGAWKRLGVGLAGAFGVERVLSSTVDSLKRFTAEADRAGKISEKLGIPTETLSKLGYAASRTDVDFGNLTTALQRFTRRLSDAATTGAGPAAKALEELGLSAKELSKLDTEQQMFKLADAFQAVASQGDRVRLAFALFDSAGVDLVRMLQTGSVALKEFFKQAEATGNILRSDVAAAAAQLNDRLGELSARWEGLTLGPKANAVGNLNELVKGLGGYVDRMEEVNARIRGLVAERQKLEQLQGVGLHQGLGLDDSLVKNTAAIKAAYDDYIALVKEKAEAEKEAQRNQQEAAANKATFQAQQAETAALKDQVAQRQTLLAQETAELRDAKAEQARIEQQFADLVKNVNQPKDQQVTGNDVSLKNLEARKALNEGDTEQAVKLAQEGAEMLQKLKDQGNEAGYVLSYLAKQLQGVATEAAGEKTQAELIDVNQAKAGIDAIKQELAALQQGITVPIKFVTEGMPSGGTDLVNAIKDAAARSGRR